MTARTIIERAMKAANLLGISETPSADDANAARDVFNMMLDQWNLQRLMSYYTRNQTFDLVASQASYTIGADSNYDFNTTYPQDITSAFLRDTRGAENVDYPLEIISNDEFQAICQKTLQSTIPQYLNYAKNYGTYTEGATVHSGTIRLYPVPSLSSFDIGLSQTKILAQVSNLLSEITLPYGYDSAMVYNLAEEICIHWGKNVPADIHRMAVKTKANIKRGNIDPSRVVNDIPRSLNRTRRMNIETGGYVR